MKLYNPDKCSSFKMQFGFDQPLKYIPNNRKQKRNKNKRAKEKLNIELNKYDK
tara:strand:+ start:34 stop:192 length:159 start_codon:yes stop_codon:yes gene_type:complete